jgi:methyltransferase-like protein/2-polyprenyl-3-methyl-5-hydroxy-6-metoxy-1,4-benzoquinol methylase
MPEEAPVTPYDQVPYPAGAYPQSHPDRLASLGILFGMSPRDVSRCRVLELGCADGSNLIPMAVALPKSTFLGIDLSASQIKPGKELITSLGLTNIQLRNVGISDVDNSFGTFDYIIAHGVYSWVPAQIQEKILSICNERLSDQGVGYVSYNTYPGWRMRGMLRDMMLYHSRKFDDPQKQIEQARALINWLAETISAENDPYGLLLKRELEQMRRWRDTYFRHDSLAEINEPLYFHQFMERAERHGLQYLAEAEFPSMLASNYAAPIGETLNRLGRGIIEMEQYMDFLRNRMFRQTLLCHRSIKLNRALGPWSLAGLHVAACLQPANAELNFAADIVEMFRGHNGLNLSTSEPIVKAAFVCLTENWPKPIPIRELVIRARTLQTAKATVGTVPDADAGTATSALRSAVLTAFAKGLCELHAHPPPFAITPGELPSVCPFARWQAARGDSVTNRRHERLILDRFEQHLLPLLDGTHDRNYLAETLTTLASNGTLTVTVDDKRVGYSCEIRPIMASELEKRLRHFGRCALLTG